MSDSKKVIVIGCGIGGPVLAVFLKQRGYEPIIYERTEGPSDAGIGHMLQPNGLKVLSSIPGFLESLPGVEMDTMRTYSTLPEDEGLLGEHNGPSLMREAFGFAMRGVRRSEFISKLVQTVESFGIPIHWGHRLASLEQDEQSVRAVFADGSSDSGVFLVGCDGLHSATRIALFGHEPASFTGLTQTGGISPTPEALADKPAMVNWLGDGFHMIAYRITPTLTSWAITQREGEARETWRAADQEQVEATKKLPPASWGWGASELVKNALKIVKYGLYDRPELPTWHKGRVVLLGDAAHPTSPHLGQGANQTFEDVYHLTRLLDQHGIGELEAVFTEYEQIRIPRCAELVKGARKQGESRVVHGVDACKARNEGVRAFFQDDEIFRNTYTRVYETQAPAKG
ncbi:hypothetical protein BC834DRAFT_841247 [Gloeopeniophorella convolvens]|nr:hypothetical protein BC834DRAFT_841247 [Gloeopeniophorella convolvens]